jgi:hypothetical protein
MVEPRRERAVAEALDRYWDAVRGDVRSAPPDELEPALAATARRVQALDTTQTPHPAFASALWEELMTSHALSATASADLPLPTAGAETVSTRPLAALPRAHPLARLAAALLLFALLAGSVLAVLYPYRPHGDGLLPILAPVGAPTATVDSVGGSLLLDLTLTDLPPMRTFGGIDVTEYPPGAYSEERTPYFPEVFHIVVGPMTMIVAESPEPVQIIAPGASTTTSNAEEGDEAVLGTGTTVVAPAGSVLALHNDGTMPTRQLSLISGGDAYASHRDGATWRWGSVGMPQDLAPPVTIRLEQLTLNPSAALPLPESGWGEYAAATLDAERGRELSFDTDAGWRNTGLEPMQVYLLKLTSGPIPDGGLADLETP